jgi:uncharacterized protein YbjT (DUF2867 family)
MEARSKIAVAGATGKVGRHAVEVLEERGHDVVAISRSAGVDLITGEGLAQALAGVGWVIDAVAGASPEQQAATDFFTTAARNLQRAGAEAGVQGIVAVSIIGIDRFAAGYAAAKQAHERATLAGPLPARILRAAQFHELVPQLVDAGREDDVSRVPEMRTQLVAARAVAEALADLVTAPSALPEAEHSSAAILEIAGPREESLVEMARLLVSHRGDGIRVEGARNPADPEGHLYDEGALLPGPQAVLAGPTFADWLRADMRAEAASVPQGSPRSA